jgi:tetratricopeptide (TPR) repeat protein
MLTTPFFLLIGLTQPAPLPAAPRTDPSDCAVRLIIWKNNEKSLGTAAYVTVGDTRRYLVTAYHNVYKSDRVELSFDEKDSDDDLIDPLGGLVEGWFLRQPARDLCVFRCTENGVKHLEGKRSRRPTRLADDTKGEARKDRTVFAVGNPDLVFLSQGKKSRKTTPLNYVAGGTISAFAKLRAFLPLDLLKKDKREDAGETSVLLVENLQITPGFSGGPVIDTITGDLVGIVLGGDPDARVRSWAVRSGVVRELLAREKEQRRDYPPGEGGWPSKLIEAAAYSGSYLALDFPLRREQADLLSKADKLRMRTVLTLLNDGQMEVSTRLSAPAGDSYQGQVTILLCDERGRVLWYTEKSRLLRLRRDRLDVTESWTEKVPLGRLANVRNVLIRHTKGSKGIKDLLQELATVAKVGRETVYRVRDRKLFVKELPFPHAVLASLDRIEAAVGQTKQNTEHIIRLLEQQLQLQNSQNAFLNGRILRMEDEIARLRQSPIPPEAQRLARQIPNDAGKYGLALKALAEQRFNDANRLWDELIKEKKAELARLTQMKGMTAYYAGRLPQAITYYREARTLLPDDPSIMLESAAALSTAGSDTEAQPLFERCLELLEAARSPNHLTIAWLLNMRAMIFSVRGQRTEAIPWARRAAAAAEKAEGQDPVQRADVFASAGAILSTPGGYDEANKFLQRAVELLKNADRRDPLRQASILERVARAFEFQGNPAGAEPLLKRAQELLESVPGIDPLAIVEFVNYRAVNYEDQGKAKAEDADRMFREAKRLLGDQWQTKQSPQLAGILLKWGRFAMNRNLSKDAEAYYVRALKILDSQGEMTGPFAAFASLSNSKITALGQLSSLYARQCRWEDMDKASARAVQLAEGSSVFKRQLLRIVL